jgi:hypothetical protein
VLVTSDDILVPAMHCLEKLMYWGDQHVRIARSDSQTKCAMMAHWRHVHDEHSWQADDADEGQQHHEPHQQPLPHLQLIHHQCMGCQFILLS